MSQIEPNTTADRLYAFDFVEWGRMKTAARDEGLGDDRSLLYDFADDQDLLIVMQPAGRSGEYYELGYVTPDQLRDALRLAGLLPDLVEGV